MKRRVIVQIHCNKFDAKQLSDADFVLNVLGWHDKELTDDNGTFVNTYIFNEDECEEMAKALEEDLKFDNIVRDFVFGIVSYFPSTNIEYDYRGWEVEYTIVIG